MKQRKRLTLWTAASVLTLGLASAPLAAQNESPGEVMPGFPQIVEKMMERADFGGFRRGARKAHARPMASCPLVSIALANGEELELSDAQVKSLKDIRDAFTKKSIKDRADMKTTRLDIRRALEADTIDFADLEQKMRANAEKGLNLRIARLKAIQEGKAVLSDAQQKELKKFARSCGGRGHGRFGPPVREGRGMREGPGTGEGRGMRGRSQTY